MSIHPEPWHVDRRVPLALIVTFILTVGTQTAGMVWWAARLSSSVDTHDRRITQLEAADARHAAEAQRISEALVRLDERLAQQTEILREIRTRLATP